MNKVDPSKIQMSQNAVVLNEASVSFGVIRKEQKLLNNPNYWHKVVVQNIPNLSRDFVLKTILDYVHPLDFIPVCYTVEHKNASFFARNCKLAIEKLCTQNLVVPNSQNVNQPVSKWHSKFSFYLHFYLKFKLLIILAFCTTSELVVNVQENIASVLTKKYNPVTKTLNLDSFHKDPDLTEFCLLSQPKILYFVLYLSKPFQIQNLRLTNNDIQLLSPIESIWGMKSLTMLDLRNNMIEKISELNILKSMQITELYLDGNPLCDLYDEYTYVQAVKEVCPKIEKLDGVLLGQNGFLAYRRNYLCNRQGQDLVDQFLQHYISLYDGNNRTMLSGLYHKDAMFSLTCAYLLGQTTTSTSNLGIYKSMHHNIKVMSNLANSERFLMVGPTNICDMLCKLPTTEHDPYNFTVDLMYYSDSCVVLTVTGVFRECTESLMDPERIIGFTRTFVLCKCPNDEFQIINEQLHVSNATSIQQQRAFKIVKVSKPLSSFFIKAENPQEKAEMAKVFKVITTLNLEWSKKCLEECQYDLKKSLLLFVDLYKVDKIPEIGFSADSSNKFSSKNLLDYVTSKYYSFKLEVGYDFFFDVSVFDILISKFEETLHGLRRDKNMDKPKKYMGGVEKTILLEIINKYRDRIENKKTDAVSVAQRKAAWQIVASEFNSNSSCNSKTPLQIQKVWENMKSRRRKELGIEKRLRMKTGGGPPEGEIKESPIDGIIDVVDIEMKDVVDCDSLFTSIIDNNTLICFYCTFESASQPDVQPRPRHLSTSKKGALEREVEARLERTRNLQLQDAELHKLIMQEQQFKVEKERFEMRAAELKMQQEEVKLQLLTNELNKKNI
ncbi:hypothetical protein FQR65_LT10829 [Abscondita terminalis]|nr:hypothetical protein FQR65_LT10829 [Abscondita terminalis]